MDYNNYFQTAINNLDKNKKNFLEFDKKLRIEGLSLRRRLKYIRMFSVLNRILKKSFNNIDKKDIEKYLLYLQSNNYSEDTKEDYLRMFKRIIRVFNPKLKIPKIKFHKKRKLPEDILSEAEIEQMISYSSSIQERTFISVLYESGCRIGEILAIKNNNIDFDEHGAVLHVDGKTGRRRIRIINSAELLKKYLEINKHDHIFPFNEFKANYLLKRKARNAGINKRIYPHLFRHSRATHLAKHLTEQELKVFFGWTGGSSMAAIYVHLSGKDIDDKIININSIPKVNNDNHIPNNNHIPNGMLNNPDFQNFLLQAYQTWQKQQTPIKSFARTQRFFNI